MMDAAKKRHLAHNVKVVSDLQKDKYVKGQKEHGGKMWLKTGLLHAALEEVADLANYLPTIEDQIATAIHAINQGDITRALMILEGLLIDRVEPFE